MMAFRRLDTVFPALGALFREASEMKQRRATLIACQQAASTTGLTAPEVADALAVIGGSAALESSLPQRLDSMVYDFDAQYGQLEEVGGRTRESLQLFRKARAVSAIVFALSSDEGQLHEAIYEAINAMDDQQELMALLEDALS